MTRQAVVRNLQGIFAPVVTPFDLRGNVDAKRFRENILKLTGTGLGGIVVAGSTGEAPMLAENERLRLLDIAREVVRPPELLIAGTGLESTQATVYLSRAAIGRGADALLVLPPCYYKTITTSELLEKHFKTVADSATRPILIYSIPQFSGIEIPKGTLARLSRHPNICGLKESSGDLQFMRSILRHARPDFRVLSGSAVLLLDSLRAGAAGAVIGQANFVPALCVAIYEAFKRRQWSTARQLQARLAPLATKIAAAYGVAGIKAAADFAGYNGGDPRPPLLPLTRAQRRQVGQTLHEAQVALSV